MTPAVEVLGLSRKFRFRFRGVRPRRAQAAFARSDSWLQVLDRVTFSVPAGEVFGLFGPPEAGKSVLLRILSTLLAPSAGEARVGGVSVRRTTGARRRVGWVWNSGAPLVQKWSAEANLSFWAELLGLPPERVSSRVTALLRALGWGCRDGAPVRTFTPLERLQLRIAQALVHDPAVLLLDGVTRGLDPWQARTLRQWISGTLAGRLGKTVILATRQPEDLRACGRAVYLRAGRLQGQGGPEVVLKAAGLA